MNPIKIDEYKPAYAKSIAEMWNRSSQSWGGSSTVYTEETVLSEHANSTNLHVFLALDGEDVVGYCSFSHYKEDEGALYIPLLNVRTDYHGKKIGKALVLRAVQKTVELGWPRLDLYTWPGNTKAVPTYKKCGFFWEKRDGTTHLMNFIPTVLQTEAVKDYFSDSGLHWYNDCKRSLEIVPDGRKDDGFEYYEYAWENKHTRMRMEFERTGRGLCLIETDDYLIRAAVESHELVYGRNYKIRYEIRNKSGKPLHIKIKGKDNKNIRFDFEQSQEVQDLQVMDGTFHVGEIIEEQNEWRTHPTVSADILVNGKLAVFGIGVIPMFPGKVSLTVTDAECFIQTPSECYLTIENNFHEEAVFDLELPSNDQIKFQHNSYQLRLASKAKETIAVPYILQQYCLYMINLPVKVSLFGGETIRFKKPIHGMFKGRTGTYGGETDYAWIAVNGSYSVQTSKFNNEVSVHHFDEDAFNTWWLYPKLGTPVSAEFSKQRPSKVNWFQEQDAVVLQALYESEDFKKIELTSVVKLFANGLVERYFEIKNCDKQETKQDTRLSESFYHDLFKGVIPYDGKYVRIEDSHGAGFDYWESDRISENWMFSYGDKTTRGICWPRSSKMKKSEWHLSVEHELGKIPGGASRRTESTYMAFGTFKDWHSFRGFALKESVRAFDRQTAANHFELSVNGGNPFVPSQFNVELRDHKKAFFDGCIRISAQNDTFPSLTESFKAEEQKKQASFPLSLGKNAQVELLHVNVQFASLEFERKTVLFPSTDERVREEIYEQQGMDIFTLHNGVMSIKACPAFANSLFSLEFDGREWLDSSFPSPQSKSWWNPWFGGIGTQVQEISNYSILQEKREADFVTLKDNKGNDWRGIRVTVRFAENVKYKGLELHHYYLLLSGSPILCNTTKIVQKTGSMFNHFRTHTWSFMKPDSDIKNSWLKLTDNNGNCTKYNSGRVKYNLKSENVLQIGSVNREEKMLLMTDLDASFVEAFSNIEITAALVVSTLQAKNNDTLFTPPIFYGLVNADLTNAQLKDLHSIQFKPTED